MYSRIAMSTLNEHFMSLQHVSTLKESSSGLKYFAVKYSVNKVVT